MHKILIYDDEKDILQLAEILLKNQYEVHTKSRIKNPVEEISEINPDIVLMDLSIPDTGGEKAVQLLRNHENTKNVRVFFFSANHDITSISRNSGANGYIMKPFKIKELQNFLKEQLEKGSRNE